jgi:hypothetical protein
MGLSPRHCSRADTPAQNEITPSARGGMALASTEDHDASTHRGHAVRYLTGLESEAAFELLSSRRWRPRRHSAKVIGLSVVCLGFGRPFRLAKLTACRKVGGLYRRSPAVSRPNAKETLANPPIREDLCAGRPRWRADPLRNCRKGPALPNDDYSAAGNWAASVTLAESFSRSLRMS